MTDEKTTTPTKAGAKAPVTKAAAKITSSTAKGASTAKKTAPSTTKASSTAKASTAAKTSTTKAAAKTSPSTNSTAKTSASKPTSKKTSTQASSSTAKSPTSSSSLGSPEPKNIATAAASASIVAEAVRKTEDVTRSLREEVRDSVGQVAAVAQEQYHKSMKKGPAYAVLIAPKFVLEQGISAAKATGRAVWEATPAPAKKLLSR